MRARKRVLGGQAVAFAPHALPNDTTLETQRITLGAEAKKINNQTSLCFRPIVTEAQVDIPAVKQLLGTNARSTITYEQQFLDAPAGQLGDPNSPDKKNPAEIFARVKGGAPKVAFSTEQAGGLAKPDFTIEGLSRSLGPVPKVDRHAEGRV